MTAAEFDEHILAANARIATKNAQMREGTHALQALVQRKQALVVRLEETLAELKAVRLPHINLPG